MRKILFATAAVSCLLAIPSCKHSSKTANEKLEEELLEEMTIDMNMFDDSPAEDAEEQEEDTEVADEDSEEYEEGPLGYCDVDTKPTFESKSDTTFRDWVAHQIKYPQTLAGSGKGGTVMAQFSVDTSGKVSDIKIIRSVDPTLDSEVIRVLQSSPDWKSASHGDSLVKVSYIIPVKFIDKKKNRPANKKNEK